MVDNLSILNGIEEINGKIAVVYGVNTNFFDKTVDQLKWLGTTKVYAADRNQGVWGTIVNGVKVLSWDELVQLDLEEDIAIVISSVEHVKAIENDLINLKLRTQNIYTQYCLKLALFYNRNRIHLNESDKKMMSALWNLERTHCEQDFLASIITSGCFALENQLFGNPVHIFNAGKVGSKTVVKSCHEHKVIASHAHTIIPHYLTEEEKEEIRRIYKNQEKVKIISLVREPISRDISFFFENIWIDSYCSMGESIEEAFDIWMKECLYKTKANSGKFPTWYMDMNKPLFKWFDDEIREVFDIDIFEYPFDVEKGYSVIKKEGVDLLLIKLEKLNELSEVIGKFLKKDAFEIYTENDSNNKPYVNLYKQFREQLEIPRDYFEYYYGEDSRLNHFYSEDEIQKFIKRWSGKVNDRIQFFK